MVRIPAKVILQRRNGTLHIRENVLPSTAICQGGIAVKKTLSQARQVASVLKQTQALQKDLERTDDGEHPNGRLRDLVI